MYFHVFKKLKKRNIFFHYCAIGAIAFLFYLLFSEFGHAAQIKPSEMKGEWQFEVVKDQESSFSYCQAKGLYDNHLKLVFAQDLTNTLNMAIEMPKPLSGFKPTPMRIKFDRMYDNKIEAYLDGGQLLVLPLVQKTDLYKIIARSRVLNIEGPEDIIMFNLKGSSAALSKLRECTMLQRLPTNRSKPISTQIKKISPVVPKKPPEVNLSIPVPQKKEKRVLVAATDILPTQVRPIFANSQMSLKAHINKSVNKDWTLYQWQMMGIDVVIKEKSYALSKAGAFIETRTLGMVSQLQANCGPDGISFLGPLNNRANKLLYRSLSFICDLPKDPWYKTVVLFYDQDVSKLFEISYQGSEKISKRIDNLKEHTLRSIKEIKQIYTV